MPKLIGITGRARSGKDTLGDYLNRRHRFHRMSFAGPLKEAMADVFDLDVSEFHDQRFKELVPPSWEITRRAMLQRGADALRKEFGQDLFIRRWASEYAQFVCIKAVAVTDVRYPAEAEAIRSKGGIIILLHRDEAGLQGEAAAHSSEQQIPDNLIDRTIVNNSSLEHLFAHMDTILQEEFK